MDLFLDAAAAEIMDPFLDATAAETMDPFLEATVAEIMHPFLEATFISFHLCTQSIGLAFVNKLTEFAAFSAPQDGLLKSSTPEKAPKRYNFDEPSKHALSPVWAAAKCASSASSKSPQSRNKSELQR